MMMMKVISIMTIISVSLIDSRLSNVLGTVISGYGVRGTEEEECSCGCSGREPQTEEEVEEEETEFGPDKEEMEMLL